MSLSNLIEELTQIADPDIARHSAGFFKTSDGEYGAGDAFLGVRVPELRKRVKTYKQLTLEEITELLYNNYHELRLLGVFFLVNRYEKAKSQQDKTVIQDLYIQHINQVNNWDLVDSSAHKILGPELLNADRSLLTQYLVSDNLWLRRIAIMTTFFFIKQQDFSDTFDFARQLLEDKEDLIHKAVGWMLREIGKIDFDAEKQFLDQHYQQMPRTMLRYAIEKFPQSLRQDYLQGNI